MIPANGLCLAYIGDAYYELAIRKYLLEKGLSKVNDLHENAIRFTSASGQELAIRKLLATGLSETEISVYRRGRNSETIHKPKHADLATYHQATGFEALIGHLYLSGDISRLESVIVESIAAVEENPV